MPDSPDLCLYIFDHGYLDATDVPFVTRSGQVRRVTARYFDGCYLVRHPRGIMIWDTGLADQLSEIADNSSASQWRMVVTRPLCPQLSALGIAPGDIDYLAFSHLHDDHTGNAELFSSATVLVHAREYAMAFQPEPPDGYTQAHYAGIPDDRIKQLQGDHDVFGDGLVVILEAPGHTPGHQVLLGEGQSQPRMRVHDM
jgi:N-acyl homoserine lactone hydrolase